jgi:alanine racemase
LQEIAATKKIFLKRKYMNQSQIIVNKSALIHNYNAIKQFVGEDVTVLPVIKADGYSAGAELLASVYSDCEIFGVADLAEAKTLHGMFPDKKFLILYQPLLAEAEEVADMSEYVICSVFDTEFAAKLNSYGKPIHIHIEVETGMCRLGVGLNRLEEFCSSIKSLENIIVDGIYSHYSSADSYEESDREFTLMQTKNFETAISLAEGILGKIRFKHICSGEAIFNPSCRIFNMVRPGYILHGYYPCEEMKSSIKLLPAYVWKSFVSRLFDVSAGSRISYGHTFFAERDSVIASVPVGYSDGLPRVLSNNGFMVASGRKVPIVGNITMDYTMVDVTDIPISVGDEVYVFDNDVVTVDDMAKSAGTIGYEILTNIKEKISEY